MYAEGKFYCGYCGEYRDSTQIQFMIGSNIPRCEECHLQIRHHRRTRKKEESFHRIA